VEVTENYYSCKVFLDQTLEGILAKSRDRLTKNELKNNIFITNSINIIKLISSTGTIHRYSSIILKPRYENTWMK
jgi:hypothetical protein